MQRALELSMRDMSTEEVVSVQSRHAPTSNNDDEDEVNQCILSMAHLSSFSLGVVPSKQYFRYSSLIIITIIMMYTNLFNIIIIKLILNSHLCVFVGGCSAAHGT